MKYIKNNDKLAAIIYVQDDWKEGLNFLTSDENFIQVGTWFYNKGKELKAHTHIENKRVIDYTQEAIIVLNGSVRIDFYNNENIVFQQEKLNSGDIGIIIAGGHGYEILEDKTRIVEVKNGPFISIDKDKKLI